MRQQLAEAETGYRQARSVKASLEAEAAAARQQLEAAQEEGVELRASLAASKAEMEAAVAAKEKEANGWKSKWKAQAQSCTEAGEKLEAAEQRCRNAAARDHHAMPSLRAIAACHIC